MLGRFASFLPTRSGRLALAGATGILVVLAAPGVLPWRTAALFAWVAFAPLLLVVPRSSVRQAALLGFLAGMVVNLGACAWFPGLLARFSNLHPVLAVLAAAAIAAWHSAGWAAWAAATCFVAPRIPPLAFAPLAFVVLERWMPWVFPFSLALSQAGNTTIAQSAELGGPYLLSALCVAVGAALANLAAHGTTSSPRRARLAALVPLALVAAASLFGHLRRAQIEALRSSAPALRLAAIQAGFAHTTWARPAPDAGVLARYQDATARAERDHGPLDLVLWPERAYPGLLRRDAKHDYPADHPSRVRRGFQSPLLFGLTSVDVKTRNVANSAALADRDGRIEVFYDKAKLIPYSEWLPEFLRDRVPGGKRYEAGHRMEPLRLRLAPGATGDGPSEARLQAFICYEAAFPAYVRDLLLWDPQLLVNLSDDSWFGDTAEPEQHLAHAVLRAIESRRDLLRATGSGVSAFVTAAGEVQQRTTLSRTAQDDQLLLVEKARLLSVRSVYGAVGDLFAWASLTIVTAALGLVSLRRKPSSLR